MNKYNVTDKILQDPMKFACLAFENISINDKMSEYLDLGDGIHAFRRPFFEIDKHWIDWLGTLQIEHFQKSNLMLFASMPTQKPEILDDENEALQTKLYAIWYSLIFQGMPHYDGSFIASGACQNGELNARTAGKIGSFYRPHMVMPQDITENKLRKAFIISVALHDLYTQKGKYIRLKKGLSALIDSFKEDAADEKLHQLARAIEAIIKPEQGRTERQFIHRCKVFGGGKKDEGNIFREIYQLRSAIEHMNSWNAVLEPYEPDIEKTGSLRAYQAQLLVCDAYIKILSNRSLWPYFETDDTLNTFWKCKDDELQKIWGPTFDFINEAKKDFYPR